MSLKAVTHTVAHLMIPFFPPPRPATRSAPKCARSHSVGARKDQRDLEHNFYITALVAVIVTLSGSVLARVCVC